MSSDALVRKWEARLGIASSPGLSREGADDIGKSALLAIRGPLAAAATRVVRGATRICTAEIGAFILDRSVEVALTASGVPIQLRLLPSVLSERTGRIGELNAPFLAAKGWRYAISRCDLGWLVIAGARISPGTLASFAALAGTLWRQERETAQSRATAEIDKTTGLLNRLGLQHRMALAPRNFVVVFADLDDLKVVNDRDGHAAGDRLLKAAASVLSAAVRTGDHVARIGGDEFVVVAFGDSTESLLGRLRGACARARIRCSFGAALVPGDAAEYEAALKVADARMYEDKRLRKGRTPR